VNLATTVADWNCCWVWCRLDADYVDLLTKISHYQKNYIPEPPNTGGGRKWKISNRVNGKYKSGEARTLTPPHPKNIHLNRPKHAIGGDGYTTQKLHMTL